MDSPQGPHQPTQSNWMYMQHLLQQLQDHQQPPQPQQHQQQHHLQHPPPPPSPHQQQQQQPPPPPPTPPHQPPPTPPPPQPPHQHHPIRQQPPLQQQQQQPPPPPQTQPHHHNPHHHHPHHQSLPQHHQPLQMQQMPSQPQQYQHHQQQQQYKPPPPQPQPQQQYKPPPPPPQQQQQASKQYLRADDHSYSVESLLGNPRVELSQPVLPTPVHPTALLPTPSYPPPLLPRVLPGPLLTTPIPPKSQPDNEMMVMSFLNELEGGKKVPSSAAPPIPPATLQKPLPPTPTSSFSQVLVTHPPLHPHLTPTTLHLVLPGDTSIPTTAATTRVNHNGNTPGLHISIPHISPLTHEVSPPQETTTPTTTATTIRMQHTSPMTHEASPPQEPMSLNPVYPGSCEGDGNGEGSGGAPMVRLERGDSASSMSQLDLALSDDSNPLLDQLESALESDSSIQAKASPEGPVPADASCCSDDAREVGEAAKEQPPHPQTEMFMSLLDAPSSDATRHAPLQPQSPQQPSPPSHPAQPMLTDTQEQDSVPGAATRPSQDSQQQQDKGVHPEASEKVPVPCSRRTPPPDTTKEDAGGSPIVAQIVPLCATRKPAQGTHKETPKVTPMVVQISSPSGDSGSPEDTHIEEDQASPTDAEMDAAAAAAAGPSDNTKDTPTAPKSPEEVSVVSPTASPVPDTPAREPSPPKDTPESSQDTELVGETISEDSVQALTDIEAPSGDSEAKQDTAQDSTPRDTSNPSKDIPPRSSPTLPDAATAAPGESEEGNTSPHEIATVYIIEPKQENVSPEKQVPEIVEVTPEVSDEDSQQQQQQHPEPQLEPAAPEKESSNKQHKQEVIEVSPGRADKEAVVGSQLELRTKKVKVPRKETHFFEPTVVPPEKQKLMVMCYVCDTNVKVAKFKHHLFFGFVRCHYCNRRLMGCRLLMEDLNNPEKSVCFSSPSRVHSFSKWAGDPIEHLSYYIRKDLVIKRFCAGKTKPPPVPEIVAEIHSYISRLSVLESIGPWCYAFERCQKYIQERINAEPKAFDQNLRNSISASLAAHSARLGPSSPLVDRAKSPNTEGSRPATSTPPQERTATPPVPQPAEDKESRTLPVIQAVTSEKVTVEPVIVMEPPVTQSEESVDDPMETVDDPLSDAPENAPPTPEASTPASTPQPAEVPHKTPRSAEKPSEETTSRVTPPPKAMPVNQTITRLRDMLSGSVNSSRRSSPSRSSRTSKTATPEPPPTAQSDVELVNDTRTTTNSATTTAAITTTTITTRTAAITKKSIAGTTLIRQWGTKAKVHTPAVRRSTQGESWPVKNENYLIIKYPTEACPDLCPSCYTAFNPMQATVQCSSFLMTVRCESCKLTLFVSQDPPSPRPRKKRRL